MTSRRGVRRKLKSKGKIEVHIKEFSARERANDLKSRSANWTEVHVGYPVALLFRYGLALQHPFEFRDQDLFSSITEGIMSLHIEWQNPPQGGEFMRLLHLPLEVAGWWICRKWFEKFEVSIPEQGVKALGLPENPFSCPQVGVFGNCPRAGLFGKDRKWIVHKALTKGLEQWKLLPIYHLKITLNIQIRK